MKSTGASLLAHMAGSATTLAYGLIITRSDGQNYGFTSHDVDQTVLTVALDSSQGLDVTSIATSPGLGVDNLELTTLDDGTLFTRAQVFGGLWQGAEFVCFRYNWADVSMGVEYLLAGTIGNVSLKDGSIVCELRGLQQYLQQSVGSVSSKTCRARLGDAKCRKVLTGFTHSGSVDASPAPTRQVFKDAGLSQASDYFSEGEIEWLTGNNAGLFSKVKTHVNSTGAVFTLMLPLPADVQTGDTFMAIAGCRKRLEDCKVKFDNVLNFQGEPHRPGVDAITAVPEASV